MIHQNAQGFLAEIPAIRHDLPYSPALLVSLFTKTSADSISSLKDIAAIIEKDQGVTARMLHVANSAFYGLQSEVSSVARAAMVLGLSEVRSIVLSMGLRALSQSRPLAVEFNLDEYWRHQFIVAVLARSLAHDADDQDPDELFTVGLLHDLGKLIIALHRPQDWEAIEALAKRDELTCSVAEDRYWGVDHAVIGALVLKAWDFPFSLLEPVSWHHAPNLAGEFQSRAMLVSLADALVRLMDEQEYEFQTVEYAQIVELGCEMFGLDSVELAERCEECSQDEEVEHFLKLIS